MKILIVEDDFASRSLLNEFLTPYADCDVCVNGREAFDAFKFAFNHGVPYDVICLDIMMPEMDGIESLTKIRDFEKDNCVDDTKRTKIIMITAVNTPTTVIESFDKKADGYIVKPVDLDSLITHLKHFKFI